RAAVTVAPGARAEVRFLAGPFARERAHVARRHGGLGLLPLGRFRNAVGFSEHVVGPLLEAVRARLDVLLVVRALGYPDVRDRQRERRARRRPRRDPLAAEELNRVVVVRIDVDELDAGLFEPLPANRAFERAVRAAVRLGVA